jgi:hypothetical protein
MQSHDGTATAVESDTVEMPAAPHRISFLERTMPHWLAGASLCILLVAFSVAAQDKPAPKPQPKKQPSLMQKKLEHAQQILEGLALEDFPSIAKNAKSMNEIGELENWHKANSPQYRTQLQVFRFANQELVRMAEEKNLDGASLAYVQTTLSCVNCHKYVREQAR